MYRKNNISFLTLLVIVTVGAALLLGGCESKSVKDGVSSGNAAINITVSPTALDYTETTVIEATVTSGGAIVEGQDVTFTVSPTGAGYFTPTTVETDVLGVAATVFNPYHSGSFTINASAVFSDGNVVQSASVEVTETWQAAEGSIDIQLGQNLLLANGSDSTMVLITVRDAVGQRVPDSTLLLLVAGEQFVDYDSNGFWSDGRDWLSHDANNNGIWDPMGIVPSYAITEGGLGQAQIRYISGQYAGTAWLKVTVADGNIGGQAEVPIQLAADPHVNSIYLSSDSINLAVKQTGGIEIALLRAYAYDVNGNTVPEGIPVSFIITDGPGGGEHLDKEGYGPYVTMTNNQGMAAMSVHAGTVSGTIRIRAYSDSILSNATQVMVSAGPPAYITVAAEECNVDYWDNVASVNGVVAVVSDIYLNPVTDSTAVYFWTDEGTMKSHQETTHDLEGIVSTKWFAGNNVPTADGRVWIYAETSGGNVVDSSMFFNTHYPDTLIVSGVPASIPADGNTKYYAWVLGLDLNGNPVIGGTRVSAEANFLLAAGAVLQNGCYSATDRVEIKSKTLPMDYSLTGANDDGIGFVDYVTYWHPAGAVSSFPVQMTTSTAHAASSSVKTIGSVAGGATAYFTATIVDRFGNPLGDHTLNITPPSGSASPSSVETNAYGEAYFSWVTPVAAGTYVISVQDTDPRGGIVLSVQVTISD